MPHVPKSVRKSAILLALYYAVVSAAIIVFSSPLFRVLSFEYAALIALFGSLPVMWFAARYVQDHRTDRAFKLLRIVLLVLLPAVLLPISISLIFVRNCDAIYGLGYYAEIVLPSTVVGAIFGAFCGTVTRTSSSRIVVVISVWLLTFLVSLLPGYFSQRIFTYGWQYGYFPGFVWDEYIELDTAAMLWYFLLASAAFAAVKPTRERESLWDSLKASHSNHLYVVIVLLLFVAMLLFGGLLNGLSHNEVKSFLPHELQVGHITIHHKDGFSREKQTVLRFEVQRYLKEIKHLYPPVDTSMTIDVYLYPDGESLYYYVGTRRASIAKPWLGSLHIAEENLPSLKHELVHLLLKPYGNFPIYASWSTGLTEGAAVAAEGGYDGLRTADELSAWALQIQYARGVSAVMKFTGFAAAASSASYVLTGSFSKYLIETYGSEKYLSLYHTQDYEPIYGKNLQTLDAEWKNAMLAKSRMMSASDSVIARYYFERSSVVDQACLRRIGRLLHEANEAYSHEQYSEAFELFKQVYREDSTRLDALRSMVFVKIKEQQFSEAQAILDSASAMRDPNGKVLLSALRGDVSFLASGDKDEMKIYYDDAMKYAANAPRYVSAVGLRLILDDSVFDVKQFLHFRYGLDPAEQNIPQALYEHAWESQMPDSIRVGYILLRTLFNENRGEYSAAVHEWTALAAIVEPNAFSPAVRKAYDMMESKVMNWMKALGLE